MHNYMAFLLKKRKKRLYSLCIPKILSVSVRIFIILHERPFWSKNVKKIILNTFHFKLATWKVCMSLVCLLTECKLTHL